MVMQFYIFFILVFLAHSRASTVSLGSWRSGQRYLHATFHQMYIKYTVYTEPPAAISTLFSMRIHLLHLLFASVKILTIIPGISGNNNFWYYYFFLPGYCLEIVNCATQEPFQLTAPHLLLLRTFISVIVLFPTCFSRPAPFDLNPCSYVGYLLIAEWSWMLLVWHGADARAGNSTDPAGKCHVTETPAEINV